MARATLTADEALALSMARGFLLPLPRSVPINRQTFTAPTTTTITAAAGSSRIPYARPTSAFTGCAKSLRPFATSRRSEASVLFPRCHDGGSISSDLGGNPSTTMRLGTGLFMPAGAARKFAFVGLANAAAFSTVGGGCWRGDCTRSPGRTTWRLSCRAPWEKSGTARCASGPRGGLDTALAQP